MAVHLLPLVFLGHVRFGPDAEQFLLLLRNNIRFLLAPLARFILPQMALERLGLIKVLEAARTKVLERVAAVHMLPEQRTLSAPDP